MANAFMTADLGNLDAPGAMPQALREASEALKMELTGERIVTTHSLELANQQVTVEEILSLMLTSMNGRADLPEQRVNVEYLAGDQKLLIPYMLMTPVTANVDITATSLVTLRTRYWKVANLAYTEVKTRVEEGLNQTALRTYIDNLEVVNPRADDYDWAAKEYVHGGAVDNDARVDRNYGYLSMALQFNCDLRDCGVLLKPTMRLADGAWINMATAPPQPTLADDGTVLSRNSRIASKLKATTLKNIAGLNYHGCGDSALAAWARAYGLSAGLLPDNNSKLQIEYALTTLPPATEHKNAVYEYEKKVRSKLQPLAMNVLAMFGLMHLAKDHTYRTGDNNMARVGTSYLQTLRTIPDPDVMAEIKEQHQAIIRTGPHPFGLGQTYFLAKYMKMMGLLASALHIRVGVTPPPVQRLYIVLAAVDEWTSLPVGMVLNRSYAPEIQSLREETALIDANPPAYSNLWRYYGLTEQSEVQRVAIVSANTMLPLVYGFAMAQHASDNEQRDGIALAASLDNVKRTQKALCDTYTKMWTDYSDKYADEGLEKFIESTIATARAAAAFSA